MAESPQASTTWESAFPPIEAPAPAPSTGPEGQRDAAPPKPEAKAEPKESKPAGESAPPPSDSPTPPRPDPKAHLDELDDAALEALIREHPRLRQRVSAESSRAIARAQQEAAYWRAQQEQAELARKAREGDYEARDKLAEAKLAEQVRAETAQALLADPSTAAQMVYAAVTQHPQLSQQVEGWATVEAGKRMVAQAAAHPFWSAIPEKARSQANAEASDVADLYARMAQAAVERAVKARETELRKEFAAMSQDERTRWISGLPNPDYGNGRTSAPRASAGSVDWNLPADALLEQGFRQAAESRRS